MSGEREVFESLHCLGVGNEWQLMVEVRPALTPALSTDESGIRVATVGELKETQVRSPVHGR